MAILDASRLTCNSFLGRNGKGSCWPRGSSWDASPSTAGRLALRHRQKCGKLPLCDSPPSSLSRGRSGLGLGGCRQRPNLRRDLAHCHRQCHNKPQSVAQSRPKAVLARLGAVLARMVSVRWLGCPQKQERAAIAALFAWETLMCASKLLGAMTQTAP